MAITITVLKEKGKEVGIEIESIMKEAQRIRGELSKKVREFWNSPEGIKMKQALEFAAYQSGYADSLESIAKDLGLGPKYQDAAKSANIGNLYKLLWGKPVKE
jgi:hypothetical protein